MIYVYNANRIKTPTSLAFICNICSNGVIIKLQEIEIEMSLDLSYSNAYACLCG